MNPESYIETFRCFIVIALELVIHCTDHTWLFALFNFTGTCIDSVQSKQWFVLVWSVFPLQVKFLYVLFMYIKDYLLVYKFCSKLSKQNGLSMTNDCDIDLSCLLQVNIMIAKLHRILHTFNTHIEMSWFLQYNWHNGNTSSSLSIFSPISFSRTAAGDWHSPEAAFGMFVVVQCRGLRPPPMVPQWDGNACPGCSPFETTAAVHHLKSQDNHRCC